MQGFCPLIFCTSQIIIVRAARRAVRTGKRGKHGIASDNKEKTGLQFPQESPPSPDAAAGGDSASDFQLRSHGRHCHGVPGLPGHEGTVQIRMGRTGQFPLPDVLSGFLEHHEKHACDRLREADSGPDRSGRVCASAQRAEKQALCQDYADAGLSAEFPVMGYSGRYFRNAFVTGRPDQPYS